MTDSSASELLFQQKILDHIKELTVEINQVKDLIDTVNDERVKARKITGALHRLIELSSQIENDSSYFFELSNSKRLMMNDCLQYIRKLEQELKELKP